MYSGLAQAHPELILIKIRKFERFRLLICNALNMCSIIHIMVQLCVCNFLFIQLFLHLQWIHEIARIANIKHVP